MKENSYYLYDLVEGYYGSSYKLDFYLLRKSRNFNIMKDLFDSYKIRENLSGLKSKLFFVKAKSSFEAKQTILSSMNIDLPKHFEGEIIGVR